MATFQDPNQEIEAVGTNFNQEFGSKPVATKPVTLTATVLNKPMTSDEIQANFKIKEVALSDVYSAIDTIDIKSNHLFFVKDDQGVTQAVYVFQENGKWKIVSPTSDEGGAYSPGLIIYSL